MRTLCEHSANPCISREKQGCVVCANRFPPSAKPRLGNISGNKGVFSFSRYETGDGFGKIGNNHSRKTNQWVLDCRRRGEDRQEATWLLTGWNNEKGPDEPGGKTAPSGPTRAGATLIRPDAGAEPTSGIIGHPDEKVNPREKNRESFSLSSAFQREFYRRGYPERYRWRVGQAMPRHIVYTR